MLENRTSKLTLYSVGVVVVDKARASDVIDVWPSEELPYLDGKIIDQIKKYDVNLPDHRGVPRKSVLEGGATLKATWLPLSASNRITSPDVIKNETVLLYRYADTDKYFWCTCFREPSIRRLETVTYMYGNLTKALAPWDKDSSYWAEVSTHDKHVKLHTSDSDGEPFVYDIYLNTKAGYLEMKDNVGNRIKINSAIGMVSLEATSVIVNKAPVIFLDGVVNIGKSLAVAVDIVVAGPCHAASHPIPGGPAPSAPDIP